MSISEGVTRTTASRTSGDLTTLLHDFLQQQVSRNELDPMTARNYRSALRGLIAVADTVPITADDLDRWKEAKAHLRPSTRRSHFSMVRSFCAWLVRNGHMDTNPTVDFQPPRPSRRVPRALAESTIARLLAVAPGVRGRAIVMLMVGMGLRCVEVSRLEIGDWDRSTNLVVVRGKFDDERLLPMPAEVEAAVDAYLDAYPAASGPLIRSYRRPGYSLGADTLSGMVSEWMNAAGVKRMPRDGVSAHALRHTCASDVLDQCGDLRVVQEMLGHRNLSTTSIYLRRAEVSQLRSAMEGRTYGAA